MRVRNEAENLGVMEMQGHWWSKVTAALCSHHNAMVVMTVMQGAAAAWSGPSPGEGAAAAQLYHHRVRELIAKLITPCPSMTARAMRLLGRVSQFLHTGCLYKLSTINLVWWPLKCTKSNFNPVHVFLHFGTFCFVVLQLILASKLSEFTAFPLHNFNVRRGPWHWHTTKLIIYQ